jgi:hypothetical protein
MTTDFDELRTAIFELDDAEPAHWESDGRPNRTLLSQVISRDVTVDDVERAGRRRKTKQVPVTTAPTVDALREAELAVEQARATVKQATIAHVQAKGDLAVALDRWTKANGKRDTESNARDFIKTELEERRQAKTAPVPEPRRFASHLDQVAATRRTAGPDRGTGQSFRRGAAAR